MVNTTLLRRLNRGSGSGRRGRRHRPARRPPFVPRLLVLEERTLPSTFTVRNLADSGPALGPQRGDHAMFQQRSVGFAFILSIALLVSCAATKARADIIVVPNALTTVDGNSFADTPFSPLRLLQIFDSSQLTALGGPVLITQIAVRPDMIPGPSGPETRDTQWHLSTTTRSIASLVPGSTVSFADLIGPDNTLVFSGTITRTTDNLPGPGNTRQFDITLPLQTPFYYDPSAGNLLLELQVFSVSGEALRRDGVIGDPTVRTVRFVGSPTADSGTVVDFGFVFQITGQPVPEPSTFTLLSLGALGLLGYAWQRRKRA
jgi:hypothetical protein